MYTFFLLWAILGAAVLIVQIVLSLVGADHHSGELDLAEGLDLLSVRALAAGAAAFGLGGLAILALGLPGLLGLPSGAVAGVAATLGTAWLTRLMLGLDQSGSLRMEDAVGQEATVRLSVPAGRTGAGRVQLGLQGRTLELKAVTPEGAIATGTAVTIVSLVDDETVEVVTTPTLEEMIG